MIAKKRAGDDYLRKRNSLLQIGLLASTSLTLAAFTYKTSHDSFRDEITVNAMADEYEREVVEQQKEIQKEIETVKLETKQSDDQNQDQSTDVGNPDPTNSKTVDNKAVGTKTNVITKFGLPPIDIKPPKEPVVPFPDVEAQFPGGYVAMMEYINDHIEYPEEAKMMGVQGKLYLSFIVEKDGQITDVQLSDGRSLHPSLDKEAKRVVRTFPKWIPGEKNAVPVRTNVVLPIKFIIGS